MKEGSSSCKFSISLNSWPVTKCVSTSLEGVIDYGCPGQLDPNLDLESVIKNLILDRWWSRESKIYLPPENRKDQGVQVYFLFALLTFVCCFILPKIIQTYIFPLCMTTEEYQQYTEKFY